MIEIKDAARAALENLPQLIGESELQDLMLDEIELSEDGKAWLATCSFVMAGQGSPIEMMTGGKEHRVSKVVRIDAESGTVEAMKNRVL